MPQGLPDIQLAVSAHPEFDQLYRRHAGQVRAYALRRTEPAAAADDVVAEVFVVAWRRWGEVPDPALPWLLGVARKVLANQRRSEHRAVALRTRLNAEPAAPTVSPSAGLDHRVLRALGDLGERDRELLMLIAWEGLSVTEAATVLGVRPGTAAVRLHRARQRFARALSAHDAPLTTMSEVRS
jgi:RNA polymerase sigma-70 factor (ECF subfamily)